MGLTRGTPAAAGRFGWSAVRSRATSDPTLEAAHITGWRANYPLAGYRIDVAFPKQKVAIEVDGWAFH